MAKDKSENKLDKQDDSYKKFIEEFIKESDRASVVLGAAKLDLQLYQILRSFMKPSIGNKDELLEGDSPLSTFSAKIHLAQRLGLIDDEFTRALHMIRRIRNSFAHEVSGCTLESGVHRDRVRELIAPFKKYNEFKDIENTFLKGWDLNVSGRLDFIIALSIIAARLEGLFSRTVVIPTDKVCTLIPKLWLDNE